jgi:hypothetical protein
MPSLFTFCLFLFGPLAFGSEHNAADCAMTGGTYSETACRCENNGPAYDPNFHACVEGAIKPALALL